MSELVHFVPEPSIRALAQATFERHAARVRALVPDADVQHVGSTAIPGGLTKGDVDLQVRVLADRFAVADAAIASVYPLNVGEARTPALTSFVFAPSEPSGGVQLTIVDSRYDFFWRARDVLRARDDWRARYDALKRSFEGREMDDYRNAKDDFFRALFALEEYRRTWPGEPPPYP